MMVDGTLVKAGRWGVSHGAGLEGWFPKMGSHVENYVLLGRSTCWSW
jgi:hypothetical protein